jgi:hypothetical protein
VEIEMADSIITNRRSLIKAFPFFGGAALLPATAVLANVEPDIRDFLANASANDRARYHANKLADVMNEINPGIYVIKLSHRDRVALIMDQSST